MNVQMTMTYRCAQFGTRLSGPRRRGHEPGAAPQGSIPNYTCGTLASEDKSERVLRTGYSDYATG